MLVILVGVGEVEEGVIGIYPVVWAVPWEVRSGRLGWWVATSGDVQGEP